MSQILRVYSVMNFYMCICLYSHHSEQDTEYFQAWESSLLPLLSELPTYLPLSRNHYSEFCHHNLVLPVLYLHVKIHEITQCVFWNAQCILMLPLPENRNGKYQWCQHLPILYPWQTLLIHHSFQEPTLGSKLYFSFCTPSSHYQLILVCTRETSSTW